MKLALFNPKSVDSFFPSVRSVFDDFDEMFNDQKRSFSPSVDVIEQKDKFILKAELPGLEQKDVKVEVNEGVLKISGERRDEKEESEKNYFRRELRYGSFMRSFDIDGLVDDENIKASFKNGILRLELPKKNEVKAKSKLITVE